MENIILIKENGKVNVVPESEENNSLLENMVSELPHLCFDCPINCCMSCEKVLAEHAKTIDKYSFITDGYQVYSNDDTQQSISEFHVGKCSRMEKYVAEHGHKTNEEINTEKKALKNKSKALKEALATSYYGVSTMEEVYQIRYFMKLSGELEKNPFDNDPGYKAFERKIEEKFRQQSMDMLAGKKLEDESDLYKSFLFSVEQLYKKVYMRDVQLMIYGIDSFSDKEQALLSHDTVIKGEPAYCKFVEKIENNYSRMYNNGIPAYDEVFKAYVAKTEFLSGKKITDEKIKKM